MDAADEVRGRLAEAELRVQEAASMAEAADQLLEEAGQKVAESQQRLKLSRSQAAASKDHSEKAGRDKKRARGSEDGEEDEFHFEDDLRQSLRAVLASAADGKEAASSKSKFLSSCQQQFEQLWLAKSKSASPPRGSGPAQGAPEPGQEPGGGAGLPLPGTPPSSNPAFAKKERLQSRSPRSMGKGDNEEVP